jgi:two-component system, cell cycle sensor histidine kinase and response regulator CckA
MATILVVDDEPAIRQLVGRVLERRGFGVITSANANDALEVTEPIDALVVDLILPEVNGPELTARLRERHPNLPVVLISGYLSDAELMPVPPSIFLQKPMMPATVVEAVEKLLGRKS